MRRLVLLSQGTDYANAVLLKLKDAGMSPAAIVLETHPGARDRALPPGQLMEWQLPWLEKWGNEWPSANVMVGGLINSDEMLRCLKALNADCIIIAGAGIVSAEILGCARAAFNVHPGLLPWVRGVGVVWRALERRVAVGLTAHYVSPGIDRGDIVHRELLPVVPGEDISVIRKKADIRSGELLGSIAIRAGHGEIIPRFEQRVLYPYCRLPTEDEQAALDAEVANGLAVDLYQSWVAFFGGDVLPGAGDRSPPTRTLGKPV